jgi:predicted ATPase
VLRLPPLESPPDDVNLTAAQVLAFPAAKLFFERVAASGGPRELSEEDAPMVGEICRRLDGIALAIELAAGRVGVFGIQEIGALLNNRFGLLWEGRRTALLRHQTLRATLDWSYNLLSQPERVALRRMSIFAGIFTLEAARAVAAGPELDSDEVAVALESLVAKSLVSADIHVASPRYRLLDTTRAYGCSTATTQTRWNSAVRAISWNCLNRSTAICRRLRSPRASRPMRISLEMFAPRWNGVSPPAAS